MLSNARNLLHTSSIIKVIIDTVLAYQERSREIEIERRRTPFKDVEAQRIREDVTIQVKHCTTLTKKNFNLLTKELR